jgi:micrococcal nuclease
MIQGILLLFGIIMVDVSVAQEAFVGKVSFVSDGDTLWVRPEAGGPPRKLRIDGIDAPEICQAGGSDSRDALAAYVLNRPVEVTVRRYDDYGRGLARLVFDKKDLGAQMVSTGRAWSYRWRGSPGPYSSEEVFARQASLGLFASHRPELPRDFRKRHGPCHSPTP